MEIDVKDYGTGKTISFKINLGKVTLPHHIDLVIPPFKYSVEYPSALQMVTDPTVG
jgi:hypothetical protein